jgi:peptidyl-prolyl cis-trans isomerase C
MLKKVGKGPWAMIASLGLIWFALQGSAPETQASQEKVAVVNGTVISRNDFDREMSGLVQRLVAQGRSLSDGQFQELRKNVLENMINLELLYQESQKRGVKVKEVAIEEHLKLLRKGFSNEDEFQKALKEMNLSDADFRSHIEKNLSVQQFVDKEVVQGISVSDKEVRTYYDSHPEFFKRPEQVRASHILIKVDPQADASQRDLALKRIKEIQQMLQKGQDFAALAKEFSQGPTAARNGDLGYFGRGQMVKPFEKIAFALRPGEVSGIVETQFGYHLIKCTDKKPESTFAYEDVKTKLHDYLKREKERAEVASYLEKLKGKAKVERFLAEKP